MILFLVTFFVSILVGLWTYARWHYGSLEKRGIPVVPYTHPLLGSRQEINENVGGPQDIKWMKKYGNIFGYYDGRQPIVCICDPELIRLIAVKDAESFNSMGELQDSDEFSNEMFGFPLEKWKAVRSLITQPFSSAKLKLMNLPMREATLDFAKDIKKKIKDGNGVCEKFALDQEVYTMITDMLARALFSIQIGGRTDKDNEFNKIVREALMPPSGPSVSQTLGNYSHVFPFLKWFIPNQIFNAEVGLKFVKIFKQMVEDRRKSGQKMNDTLDLILEWYEKLDSEEWKRLKINEMTLIAQSFVFFAASQDQVSTMVAACIYHMTKNPELEKKIYEELDTAFKKYGIIEHKHLNELHIMQAAISECLRLYGFFHRAGRFCTKDWENDEYNLSFKKGDAVMFPIWAINRNPEFHENPDDFDYRRFLPENKDKINFYASTAFGYGPRNCTGQQLAKELMPTVLAYLLKNFKFLARKDTQLTFLPGGEFATPHDIIYVDVVER